MCGFAASNINIKNLGDSNEKCQKRGPDQTNIIIINNIQFLHNLLHITGDLVEQPIYKKDVVCLFNGEIYNYKYFGNYKNDSECIIDLYLEYGIDFSKELDGEFAICLVDFNKEKIIISNDTFCCKPLWYEFQNNKFCIASYNSQLEKLGFNNGIKLEANKTICFNLKSLKKEKEICNFVFDLEQNESSFDKWIEAFSKSIKKRTENTKEKIFIGLSSGYDSGSIACELQKQSVEFKSFSITNNENKHILDERFKITNNKFNFHLDKSSYSHYKKKLIKNCENFNYSDYNLFENQANVGLYYICEKAKSEGFKINLSGQGADEIISDYGFQGKKMLKDSCFGGIFPENLKQIFPWCNFWKGTQIKYLNAQEYVAGSCGIETRYPFLDKHLVQEFLKIKSELKNSKYKSCLDEYLSINGYPYEKNIKRGFYVL